MSPSQPSELDPTPAPGEVETMAAVLEGRHGVYAEHVAQFFADVNADKGDAARAWAWTAVTERVRKRTTQRLGSMSWQ